MRIRGVVDLLCDNHGSQWSCYTLGGRERMYRSSDWVYKAISPSLTGRLSKSRWSLEQGGLLVNAGMKNFRFEWDQKTLDVGDCF